MARFTVAELVNSTDDVVTYLVSNRDGTNPEQLIIAVDGSSTNIKDGDIYSGAGAIVGKLIRAYKSRGEWPKNATFQS